MNDMTPWHLWNLAAAIAIVSVCIATFVLNSERDDDAYIYVPDTVVSAAWMYTQLPMHECSFCSSRVNLNRHHIIPQLAAPQLTNERTNLIVLCRPCHQVVGHKNHWKKFNPHVKDICDLYGGPPIDSKEWHEMHKEKTDGND